MRRIEEAIAHLFHPRRSNNHRARVLHPESLFFLAGIAVVFFILFNRASLLFNHWGGVLGFASTITPAQVVELTNQERSKQGLPPLALNAALSQAALAKGQDMFNDQYWAHIAPDGTEPWKFIREANYTYQVAGENLARDFSNTEDMVAAWMASPTHKANIVNTRYEDIGIAVIDGSLEGYETTLVVQMFGKPKVAVAQVPDGKTTVASVDGNQDRLVTFVADSSLEGNTAKQEVLAGATILHSSFQTPPLFTPLELIKSLFLGLILMIITTLFYDSFVIGHSNTVRIVGKNLAHIILFTLVAFLLILFKGGIVG